MANDDNQSEHPHQATSRRSLITSALSFAAGVGAGWLVAYNERPVFQWTGRRKYPRLTQEQVETARATLAADCAKFAASQADLTRLQAALQKEVWRGSKPLPVLTSITHERETESQYVPDIVKVCPVARLTIDVGYGFINVVRMIRHPDASKRQRRLMIIHEGHGTTASSIQETMWDIVSHGIDVLHATMIATTDENVVPPHDKSDIPTEHRNHLHGVISLFHSPERNALRLFFDHLPTAIDFAESMSGPYEDISMCGVSGGGWTTTVYAALDPRVSSSFSVAGNIPQCVRLPSDRGFDWETSSERKIYGIAPRHIMYLIAATNGLRNPTGKRFGHYQLYNEFDNVCYPGASQQFVAFRRLLSDHAKSLGGLFDALMLPGVHHHVIPQAASEVMLEHLGELPIRRL